MTIFDLVSSQELTAYWEELTADEAPYPCEELYGGSNKGTRLLDAWNTNNTGSSIPRLSTMNTADEGRASSYFVENGSYLKLRTLQVGYTIPSSSLATQGRRMNRA